MEINTSSKLGLETKETIYNQACTPCQNLTIKIRFLILYRERCLRIDNIKTRYDYVCIEVTVDKNGKEDKWQHIWDVKC